MNFAKELLKVKILTDYYIDDFSNSYKLLFLVQELNICQPKELCHILKMAKSNLAVLAGKLRLLKYLEQSKTDGNQKEIVYRVTDLGKAKLENKIKEVEYSCPSKAEAKQKLTEILSKISE